MKIKTSTLIFVLIIAIIIVISIIANSCTVYTIPTSSDCYTIWKAEQKAANDALLKYTQSDEYKKLYGGRNPTYNNSPKANSVVGTKDDPFAGVRNSNNIPSSASPQYYKINIR